MFFYVVIEGIDGAGKSIISRRLADKLKNEHLKGERVVWTHEPKGIDLGREIYGLMGKYGDLTGLGELLLHFGIRAEHFERVIKPVYNEGGIIVSDRGDVSSFAYQVFLNNLPIDFFKRLRDEVMFVKPDLYIILNVNVYTAMKRKDDIDAGSVGHLALVQRGYLAFESLFPCEDIEVIDANRDLDDVYSEVEALVINRIAMKRALAEGNDEW